MYSFIDNTQKKLYNEDRFYAVKQREGKNMDELNKHNIDDANTENCAPQESTENQQPTMAVGTDAQETKQVAEKNTAAPEVNTDKLICPRCGKAFDQKEKKCPHCGLKNNLKLCKACGATIAKNAKRCPKCGAKNKKPFYKQIGFWLFIAIVLFLCWPSRSNNTASAQDVIVGEWIAEMRIDTVENNVYSIDESENARLKFNRDHTAEVHFGDAGAAAEWTFVAEKGDIRQYKIMNQGDSNGESMDFSYVDEESTENAEFAGKIVLMKDNIRVIYRKCNETNKIAPTSTAKSKDEGTTKNIATSATKSKNNEQKVTTATANISAGKKNALDQAYSYLNAMAFSYSGLIEQLEYEGYSTEDATYAVDHCGADWNDEAAKKAEEYLNTMSFSRSGLIEQLEYEGFTHDQAVYGVNKAY